MRLHSEEGPPTMFHFVLTNSCGLKMHGAVLQVMEEVDPLSLGGKVSQALASAASSGVGGGATRGGGGGGGYNARAGVALSPAQLPRWLRDTVRTLGAFVGWVGVGFGVGLGGYTRLLFSPFLVLARLWLE